MSAYYVSEISFGSKAKLGKDGRKRDTSCSRGKKSAYCPAISRSGKLLILGKALEARGKHSKQGHQSTSASTW